MQGLTKRQHEVLCYIQSYIQENSFAPTFVEIQTHFGFSSRNAVSKHIKALKIKGAINSEKKNQPRGLILQQNIKTQEQKSQTIELPIIGRVSAGLPIETYSIVETFEIPAYMVKKPEQTYGLKVLGVNLRDEMIDDGDILVIEVNSTPSSGDTVVALINHHNTIVSRYYLDAEGAYVKFVDRNPNHDPMIMRIEDVAIQGIVVALFRPYCNFEGL